MCIRLNTVLTVLFLKHAVIDRLTNKELRLNRAISPKRATIKHFYGSNLELRFLKKKNSQSTLQKE